jgi:hypothetical protein
VTIVCFVVFFPGPPITHTEYIFTHHQFTPISVCFVMSEQTIEPITNHVRDFVPSHEKYKVVQMFPMYEDRDEEDCNFFDDFIP